MTTRKRLRIAVWIVFIAIAGVAGVSRLHPFHTRVSWSEDRLLDVSLSDGNFRVVHLSAELSGSFVRESVLEEYFHHWTSDSTKTLTWYRHHHVDFKDAPISYLGVGCKLIVPLAIMLAFLVVEWAAGQRRQFARTIMEIIRPSDRHTVGFFRRVIRRVVVVFFGLATILAGATWVISYTGLPTRRPRDIHFKWGTLSVISSRGPTQTTVKFSDGSYSRPMFHGNVTEGRVGVGYKSFISTGTVVPTHDFALVGFRWYVRSMDTSSMGLSVKDAGIGFPCGVPVLLFSAWPIIAFLRGPYRRAARRAKGFCLQCGYNLTGLVEPRCPECGTPSSSVQANGGTSESV